MESPLTTVSEKTIPHFDGPIFDGDSHIHEKDLLFFKNYLPKQYQSDWMPVEREGPEGYGVYIGERKVHIEANREGLVPPPGKLKEWLRAMKEGGDMLTGWIKPTPDMWDAEERVKTLDRFGVESSLLFPGTFIAAIGYYPQDVTGNVVMHAYNQYVYDNWTFNYKDRVYPTPLLTLWDMETSLKEVEWIIEKGAKVVVMPMGPAHGKSPVDPYFDPIYERLNEAGVRITYHVSEANFMHPLIREWGEKPLQGRRTGQTAWQWMFCYSEIPLQMTLANLIYHNFFERFPNLRVCSVENGAQWLPAFLDKMDKMRGMAKNGYWPCGQLKERPSTIFKRHCYVVAYPEDDVLDIVNRIGTHDCLMMGSDYPHAEGVPEPMDFVHEALGGLTEAQAEDIMYRNGTRFINGN